MLPTGSMEIWNPICAILSLPVRHWKDCNRCSDISNGMPALSSASEAKKMCMFLRWMIRRDSPVDLGIWRSFSPSDLIIPLDAHVHRISTDLGLTNARKCLKTARCITDALREIWPDDPVKGDFALFGFGINEPMKS